MKARLWRFFPLLAAGLAVACGPRPGTPLGKASFEGDAGKVRTLLAQGADANGEESPLILAARAGHVEVVQILIRSGADPNRRGGVNDWTALMHAVHKNQEAAAAALIEGGADPDAVAGHRETALMMAAGYGQAGMVRVLLSCGADPRLKDVHGASALDYALSGVLDIDNITAGQCQTETVRILLNAAPELAGEVSAWPEKMAHLARCAEILRLLEEKRSGSALRRPD